jgi:hypothetical protein
VYGEKNFGFSVLVGIFASKSFFCGSAENFGSILDL